MKTEILGGGARVECAARYLINADIPKTDIDTVKLLPIPSTRDGVFVTGTDIELSSLVPVARKGDFFAGYGLPEHFTAMLREREIAYFDALYDESFTLENANLTAIGALSYLLSELDRAPVDLSFGVIGYGRIGRALARILLFLGADVRVFSSKKEKRLELGALGIKCSEIEEDYFDFEQLSEIDVLVNTAPTCLSYLFPDKHTGKLKVIDLASGDSFPGIFGIEYLPSLPARMFGESAGLAYGRAIERHLTKLTGGEGV